MNYKIIKYHCGCKYIFITDPEKRPPLNLLKCPVHKTLKIQITLFCLDCKKKVTRNNIIAAIKQFRCHDCADKRRREKNREGWKTVYKGKYVHRKVLKTTETLEQKDEREMEAWFNELQKKFAPPAVKCYGAGSENTACGRGGGAAPYRLAFRYTIAGQ